MISWMRSLPHSLPSIGRLLNGCAAAAAMVLMTAAPGYSGDPDVITRSRGSSDGLLVLWPRVSPEDPAIDALAADLQSALATIGAEAMDAAKVDVRPAPERACPPEGCRAPALSAVIVHERGGCAIIATHRSPDGQVRLVPLLGAIELSATEIGPGQRPEEAVRVRDFAPCDGAAAALDLAPVRAALGGKR
jgi:hypothetical protein